MEAGIQRTLGKVRKGEGVHPRAGCGLWAWALVALGVCVGGVGVCVRRSDHQDPNHNHSLRLPLGAGSYSIEY